jgi:hypothetical protein
MRKVLTILWIAAGVLVAVHAPTAAGQSRELQKKLASAKRLECTFTALAMGTWSDANKPEIKTSTTKLEAVFSDINIDEGTAEADSDFGKSFISVRYSNGYLHLMQISDAGPLRVTTVLAQASANGRFKAVQTRAEYTPTILPGFTSRPEMYIGDCAVGN